MLLVSQEERPDHRVTRRTTMSHLRPRHAVVIGTGIGGLLAARVLRHHFDHVTLIERDQFSTMGEQRNGVPQGWHAHSLLGKGYEILETLFPGFTDDLVHLGAHRGDTQADMRWYNGDTAIRQARSGLPGLTLSRPLLEGYLRARLMTDRKLCFLQQLEVKDLLCSADRSTITGVQLRTRKLNDPTQLLADLVVDCSGRESHSPQWLEWLGYPKPPTQQIRVKLGYTSGVFVRLETDLDGQIAVTSRPSATTSQRNGVMMAQENNRWIVTLGGFDADTPPTNLDGFHAFSRGLCAPEFSTIITGNRLIGELTPLRFPTSVRHFHERCPRHPRGFLVFGDALCSLDPIHAQGITLAAQQALNLRRCLTEHPKDLPAQFYASTGRTLDAHWNLAVNDDLENPRVPGELSPRQRFASWYMEKLLSAARRDESVARRFLRVNNLLEPPTSLLKPDIAWRVLRRTLLRL
jgi:2-polyprenyl-6-methoxyphenol hydroxylase-like FAD-dependent oxidoreductase